MAITEAISENGKGQYQVQCYNCRHSYNAMEAVWCNCLSTVRSLVCPNCMQCFCSAPNDYKNKFWDAAPETLWNLMVEEHHRHTKPDATLAAEEPNRPLVLIVEPDSQIRFMAHRIIEELGYGAVVAGDGVEGFEKAQQYLPDLVLTAALMPKLDGREMCRRIKRAPATIKTKVAVMTELYTKKKYRAEAFNEFFVDEYITKPVSMHSLQSILHKYLDAHASVRAGESELQTSP